MEEKGFNLERRLHLLFWNYGYFVRRNIRMMLKRGSDITDLDVYAIKFDEFLRPTKIAVECKHSEGGFDSILQLRGISDYYEVDVPIIVRKKIDSNAHDFINDLNMMGITHSHLEDLEQYFNIQDNENSFYKLYDLFSTDKKISEIRAKLISSPNIKDILWQLQESWMVRNPYERFTFHRNIYDLLKKEILKTNDADLLNSLYIFIFENHILTALSCVEIASTLIERDKLNRKSKLTTNLLGGNISLGEKRKLVSLVQDIIKTSGLPIDEKLFKLEPEYIDNLNELIGEMIKNPFVCQKYIRFLDFTIYNFIINQKKIDIKEISKSIKIPSNLINYFTKWNELLIKSLDDEGKIPKFLLALL
jgi:hypothetical protein